MCYFLLNWIFVLPSFQLNLILSYIASCIVLLLFHESLELPHKNRKLLGNHVLFCFAIRVPSYVQRTLDTNQCIGYKCVFIVCNSLQQIKIARRCSSVAEHVVSTHEALCSTPNANNNDNNINNQDLYILIWRD